MHFRSLIFLICDFFIVWESLFCQIRQLRMYVEIDSKYFDFKFIIGEKHWLIWNIFMCNYTYTLYYACGHKHYLHFTWIDTWIFLLKYKRLSSCMILINFLLHLTFWYCLADKKKKKRHLTGSMLLDFSPAGFYKIIWSSKQSIIHQVKNLIGFNVAIWNSSQRSFLLFFH